MIGVALMLCVAGTIEGFVSPQRLPIPVRDAIGAFTALVMLAYFVGGSRLAPNARGGDAAL